MTDILVSLRHILDEAIDTIVSVCERRNEEFPRLDAPADPSEYSPYGIRNDPVVAQSIKLGVAAASQLIATLQSPIQAAANLGFLVCRLLLPSRHGTENAYSRHDSTGNHTG